MSPKLQTLLAVSMLGLVGLTACGTLGKHYGDEVESDPLPSLAEAFKTVPILVDSIPSGAMIRLNGIKIGAGPVFARPIVDETGSLITNITVSADYTTFALARNATDIIVASYNIGDLPPKRLILARAADGGIQARGGAIPNN